MLARSKRLNLKKDFKWAATGKKIETRYLKLFIKKGENQIPRVGIAVSAKLLKKASDRHRVKRITSFAFESLYNRLPENINIVALPKAGAIGVKSDDVLSDLKQALKEARVL